MSCYRARIVGRRQKPSLPELPLVRIGCDHRYPRTILGSADVCLHKMQLQLDAQTREEPLTARACLRVTERWHTFVHLRTVRTHTPC